MEYHHSELICKTHDYFPLKLHVYYLSIHEIVLEMEILHSNNFANLSGEDFN